MTITGSPDIITNELDLSTYVSSASTTIGAIVGDFQWGPIDFPVTISNEGKLVEKFATPNNINYKDWFVAKNYLAYSSNLRTVRTCSSTAVNACDVVAEATLIKNETTFEAQYSSLTATGKTAKIFAKYAGDFGNKIRVVIKGSTTAAAESSPLKAYITKVLSTTDVAFGVFIEGTLQEFGIYSLNKNSQDISGYSNYLFTTVNKSSSYVYLLKERILTVDEEGTPNNIDIDVVLKGGVSGDVAVSNYKTSWDLFKSSDIEEVSLLMQGGASPEIGTYIIDIASSRKDCVACTSPLMTDCVNNIDPVTAIKTTCESYPMSSYRFVDGNYKYQYDSYNDVYRWVPLNGDSAGLMARTDEEEHPWNSPAGKSIVDCIKFAFYPDKTDRDELWKYNINPYTAFKEEGHVLWGDWTGVNNTAFNFVGVRRGFLYMEKQIAAFARKVMWKQNDEITQTEFIQAVEPFLRNVQGGRGISEFKVFADSTVNTSDIIDQGLFISKIAVKPIRSVRWVQITFIATRSDVDINEIVQ